MGLADNDLGMGRIKCVGVEEIIQVGGTHGSFLWVGDVGDNPRHGLGPGRITVLGGSMDHRTENAMASVWKMELPPPWRRRRRKPDWRESRHKS